MHGMAEETTEVTPDLAGTANVPPQVAAPAETSEQLEAAPGTDAPSPLTENPQQGAPVPSAPETAANVAPSAEASTESESDEPDLLQPYLDKAGETIQHEVASEELDTFLRGHIKTFREEWDVWEESARDAYVHMMTSQLVQRKAAATRIKIYDEFKLPVPSAQTTLFESIKQSQIKPKKRRPVLLMPPNLRPTYSLKK
jgi:hypothetical protein